MAQKMLLETGLLVEDGRSVAEYMADPNWDPLIYQTADVVQAFDSENPWFYFPTLNQFFRSTPRIHAILRAARTLFTATRWDEIIEHLEEQGAIPQYLGQLNLPVVRRKILKARDKGLITASEVSDLAALVAHLPT